MIVSNLKPFVRYCINQKKNLILSHHQIITAQREKKI